MSMEYCFKCDKYIDTDFNAEHFGKDVDECETTFECKMSAIRKNNLIEIDLD